MQIKLNEIPFFIYLKDMWDYGSRYMTCKISDQNEFSLLKSNKFHKSSDGCYLSHDELKCSFYKIKFPK